MLDSMFRLGLGYVSLALWLRLLLIVICPGIAILSHVRHIRLRRWLMLLGFLIIVMVMMMIKAVHIVVILSVARRIADYVQAEALAL